MLRKTGLALAWLLLIVNLLVLRASAGYSFTNIPIYAGGLGFQPWDTSWILLQASSGAINTSTNFMHVFDDGSGDISFTNNESVTFSVSYANLEVFYRLNMSNWIPCDNGTSLAVAATGRVAIRWRSPIFDVWQFFDTIGLGLGGIVLTCAGSFFTARKARSISKPYDLYLLMMGIVIAVIGMGLIVAWLW